MTALQIQDPEVLLQVDECFWGSRTWPWPRPELYQLQDLG